MTDPILRIGQSGLETTDEKVKNLVTRMVNSETPGFKGSEVTVRSFPLELDAAQSKLRSEEPRTEGTFYNQINGSLIRTGNQTDFAIGSEGLFVLSCPWGEGYTRDGRFVIDSEGNLVSSVNKFPLLGANGPISIPSGSQIEISQTGEISIKGATVDRIRIVSFEQFNALESVNGSIFKNPEGKQTPKEVESPRIVQGYVEASNVNIVDQMMELILLNRVYNMNTKIVSTRDGNLSRALEMGKAQ